MYSFGPFEFDPPTGRITKHGCRIKIQPKPAALLACLLEHRGSVVSREQIRTALWPSGTHVDFDLGIKVAVKRLRDVLGDTSEDPSYIQTIPGEGYRFIAPILAAPHILAEPVSPPARRSGLRKLVWIAAALVVGAGLIVLPGVPRATILSFRNRDWVVIAAVENCTGDKLLDGSMEYSLERELSQSRFINVAPPERIGDTLQLMRKSPATRLDEPLACEVAVRDGGIKAVLGGRVEKFGARYVLTIRVLNPSTCASVAVLEKQASLEQLPDAARGIADRIRESLGDSALPTASEARLAPATTPSLAALRDFSAGMNSVNQRNWGAAVHLLEEALRADPDFALAHIYLAHCYANLKDAASAAPHFKAAFALADGLPVRERLFILGSYYERFQHDDRRALSLYQALINLYPDDYWANNNIIGTAHRLGFEDVSIEARKRIVDLRPVSNQPNVNQANTIWWYYKRVRIDRAKALEYRERFRRFAHDLMPQNGFIQAELDLDEAADCWWRGDIEGAAEEVDRVSADAWLPHGADWQYPFYVAMADLQLGKDTAARTICARLPVPQRYECLLRAAFTQGDDASAREQLAQIRTVGPTLSLLEADEGIGLWFGDTETVKRWFETYQVPPNVISGKEDFAGFLLLREGHPAEAETALRKSMESIAPVGAYYSDLLQRLALAMALDAEGKLEEAIDVLDNDTAPSKTWFEHGWPWAQCRLKLTELYSKAGRRHDAIRIQSEIRNYFSRADRDHPVLRRIAVFQ